MDNSQKQGRYVIEAEHEGHHFEWDLSLRPTSNKPAPTVVCDICSGNCIGSRRGLGCMDDPINCWKCHNTGRVGDPNFVWNPVPPPDLVEALRTTWRDHWNKVQNDKFTLTSTESE